jgi:hypothetical protein
MRAFKKAVLAGAAAAMLSTTASAAITSFTIDTFGLPSGTSQSVQIEASEGLTSKTSTYTEPVPPGDTIVGNNRDLFLRTDAIAAGTDGGNRTRITAGNGGLGFSSDTGIQAFGSVQWDGADGTSALDTTGLNATNLTNCGILTCDRFFATVTSADLGFGYKIVVWDMHGNGVELNAAAQFSVLEAGETVTDPNTQVLGPVDVNYLFLWFNLDPGEYFLDAFGGTPQVEDNLLFTITRIGGFDDPTDVLDFTKIGALELQLNTGYDSLGLITDIPEKFALDLRLGAITGQGVPEPGTMALLGAGLLGLGALRRRKALKV